MPLLDLIFFDLIIERVNRRNLPISRYIIFFTELSRKFERHLRQQHDVRVFATARLRRRIFRYDGSPVTTRRLPSHNAQYKSNN